MKLNETALAGLWTALKEKKALPGGQDAQPNPRVTVAFQAAMEMHSLDQVDIVDRDPEMGRVVAYDVAADQLTMFSLSERLGEDVSFMKDMAIEMAGAAGDDLEGRKKEAILGGGEVRVITNDSRVELAQVTPDGTSFYLAVDEGHGIMAAVFDPAAKDDTGETILDPSRITTFQTLDLDKAGVTD